ncbi:MAG TPA: M15 family metallopeptidase, partial [Polyangium sp.]|nr:M15 family metallopeptidase [Polyangium sp.]
ALVQGLLNKALSIPYVILKVTGVADAATVAAICDFQRRIARLSSPDGRIDVGGPTAAKLATYGTATPVAGPPVPFLWTPPATSTAATTSQPAVQAGNSTVPTISTGFDTKGKTCRQRVDLFLGEALKTYGVKIGITAEFRQPGDAQRWHTAHMIYFNSFGGLKPKNAQDWNGKKVISWAHLSDPSLEWHSSINWADFLRDATDQAPKKSADGKSWITSPDETATRRRAYNILANSGIGTALGGPPHSAMVAPGYQGCAPPCSCGGNRSNHIAGMAVDLSTEGMLLLQSKLKPNTVVAVDAYLTTFGLKRPMPSEPWHVEAK